MFSWGASSSSDNPAGPDQGIEGGGVAPRDHSARLPVKCLSKTLQGCMQVFFSHCSSNSASVQNDSPPLSSYCLGNFFKYPTSDVDNRSFTRIEVFIRNWERALTALQIQLVLGCGSSGIALLSSRNQARRPVKRSEEVVCTTTIVQGKFVEKYNQEGLLGKISSPHAFVSFCLRSSAP